MARSVFMMIVVACAAASLPAQQPATGLPSSARCIRCHDNLKTASGRDVSIGAAWSASLMANSARDPYWQASVRRETLDHAGASAAIQSECASCHMPAQFAADRAAARNTAVFGALPLSAHAEPESAADGVACAVCHVAQPATLGSPESYNGNLNFAAAGQPAVLFGPYPADARTAAIHTTVTRLATVQSDHLHDSGLCGSCHTLYTTTLGNDGKTAGRFPEQMVYLEWQHSDFNGKQSCQSCHMPAVAEPAPVATLGSPARAGVRLHTFTGANFFMQAIFNAKHDELAVTATPAALGSAESDTRAFLQSQSAKLAIGAPALAKGKLDFTVTVKNLTGHKLPTSFPSRRAWLHVTVTDAAGKIVFESGRLNADGSIAGNLNDADPAKFSPHYALISAPDQVQIFEPILGDKDDHVTTALLTATHYLKDNRILPAGFDKSTASPDIAVHGEAATDSAFIAGSSATRYQIAISAAGPLHIAAELLYQPIGFRWARNLAPYTSSETQQFVQLFNEAAQKSAQQIAHAEAAAQ